MDMRRTENSLTERQAKMVLGVSYVVIGAADLAVGIAILSGDPLSAILTFIAICFVVSIAAGLTISRGAFRRTKSVPQRLGALMGRVLLLAVPIGGGGAALVAWLLHRVSASASSGIDLGLVGLGAVAGFVVAFGVAWIVAAAGGSSPPLERPQ